MALKVPIRFKEELEKKAKGAEADRLFDILEWFLLNEQMFKDSKEVIKSAVSAYGLGVTDYLVLRFVENNDNKTTLSDLSREFNQPMPNMIVATNKLTQSSLIRTKALKQDRRVKIVSCTREGKRVLFEASEQVQRAMRFWLFDLTDKEIEEFIKLSKRIIEFERM